MTDEEIKNFVVENHWVFAKTYAKTLPHEYVVRKNVKSHFNEFVSDIRNKGFKAYFLEKEYIYLKFEYYFYWTMGNPVNETIIINRAHTRDYDLKEIDGKLFMLKKKDRN